MREPRVAVLGLPGAWSSERLADALARRTGHRLLLDAETLEFDPATLEATAGGVRLADLDALVVKKAGAEYGAALVGRLLILEVVARAGLAVFPAPSAMLASADRLVGTLRLLAGGVPMPRTRLVSSPGAIAALAEAWGAVIVKPRFSSKARGFVELVRGVASAGAAAGGGYEPAARLAYVQERVDVLADLGLVHLEGQLVAAYARHRAPQRGARTYAAAEPTDDERRVAARAAQVSGLMLTTIDVLRTSRGPLVLEASAFGGFRGAAVGARVEVATLYADAVLRAVARG